NRSGPTLGGFLNATFGNAAELIIAIVALRAGHVEVVKASITGSIIGNLLLVFGASAFCGGLRHGTQKFARAAAGSPTVMLTLAVAALVMPAAVDLFAFGSLNARPEVLNDFSIWTSWVQMLKSLSTSGRALSEPNAKRSTAAGITSAATASVSITVGLPAAARANFCVPCRSPPQNADAPKTRSRLPMMLPVIDALTTST